MTIAWIYYIICSSLFLYERARRLIRCNFNKQLTKKYKKCKKLGIDLDNTITELENTLIDMAKYYGKGLPSIEDIKDFNLSTVFGVSEEDSKEYWQEREWSLIKNAEVSEARLSAILELFADDDTGVYIITNRPDRFYFETAEWLDINGISYKELHIVQGSKAELIKELELDVMVDDKPELFYEIQTAKNAGERIHTEMVCVDYPYNENAPCDVRLSREGDIIEEELFYDFKSYRWLSL